MKKLRKILLMLICAVFITGKLLEASPMIAYALEETNDEYTQEEDEGDAETTEEKEENQQEDDEDTGNADADSDKDLDAESEAGPGADEASEEAAEESENPEDLENESEAEEKEDVQQEAEEVTEEAAKEIIISFYVPKDAEGEYELLEKMAADEDGKVAFPDKNDLPEIEGLCFAGEWQDEDFNSVDEDMTFEESCRLYAVFEEDELPLLKAPVMRAPVQRASSYGIDADNPQVGQVNRYEYTGSNQTWKVPATGYYEIYCYGAQGGTSSAKQAGNNRGDRYITYYSVGTGSVRASRAKIEKDTILTIHAGGCGGDGYVHIDTSDDDGYADAGSGGWNDGSKGNELENRINDDERYQAYATGGGGGSSYIKHNDTVIISAQGGNGQSVYIHKENGNSKSGNGGSGGGSQQLNNADAVVWNTGELDKNASGQNSGNGYITIKVIRINPTVGLTCAPESWTNEPVTITADIKSEGEGLPAEYLSWETDADGNDIWTDSTTYVVSQNGTYTCKIRDVAGNIEKASIEITNIDRLLPEGELLPDTEEWTRDDIELTLNADDAAASPEDGKSGLEDKAYLWGAADSDGALLWEMDADGNEAWTDATAYAASQNGTYACQIRDKAGNISEERIKVTNIDRTAPEIKAEHPTWYSGETTVSWQGLDLQPDGTPGSGLHSEAYSFDGVDWTAENTQQITAPGTYTIYVRDAVENVGRYEIELLYDPEPEDDKGGGKGGDNPQPVNPPEQPELPEQPKEDTSGDGGNENLIPQPPLPKEPVKAEIFELAVPEVEPELKLPHSPKVKKKADTMTEITVDAPYGAGTGHEKLLHTAVMTGAATSGGIILYFALFFIIPAARIYELRGKKRKYLGTKLLLRRKVDLRKLFEKTEESSLMIKINWLYAKYNAGKKLSCIKGQDIEEKDVQAIMIVYR